ncbi:hypothetical protein PAHAL_1G343900 [Panicum hallii]|uniref:Cellulose synthase-like protein H1 n=1 Tax=Panicum hallii TaxID=206008 RepID=A0A2T8KX79_9POAL|nr:hypothetical protein PAHAL_1G343900 [Panicum hallii]
MNCKWNPVWFETYPDRLSERTGELPAVDVFMTTADPELEPPVVTVNTVLSLLALDYPAGKLACYVSDDGCSPLTCYALREAAAFARLWVPFCRKHGVAVRAPFVYFSSGAEPRMADQEFFREWTFIKDEYEKLLGRIENAEEISLVQSDHELADFFGADRMNHPTIIKILWDNSKSKTGEGFPSLIYVSREKSHKFHHHFKAGAMNVLTRVSAVLTNAPIMLNMDCDMFANNPQVILHAMCLLLGFDDEVHSGFVQAPQMSYKALQDDPFGNQAEVKYKKLGCGFAGLQGIKYNGTNCFHRRKVIYGMPPNCTTLVKPRRTKGSSRSPSWEELQVKLGNQKELIESTRSIISGDMLAVPIVDLSSRVEVAKEVSACRYEASTCWGQEIGWVYGSMYEDILTGQRIHAAGWKSAAMNTSPPAFLGSAPTGGPGSLTQYKRWATGLFEILMSRNNPILLSICKRLQLRQCLAYLVLDVWPLRAPFELCYSLLGPYCLLANHSFLPKYSEPGFSILLALFLTYNLYNFMEYMDCRLSARACSCNGNGSTDEADKRRFTFDSSPVFIPPAALAILNAVAIAVGAWRVVAGAVEDKRGGPGVGEFVCCCWLVLCFWPFVTGLGGKGSYGIPWNVKLKAGLLVAAFVNFCR